MLPQLVAVRKKFGQSLEVLRNYQTRIEELEAAATASSASVAAAADARAADLARHAQEVAELRAMLVTAAASAADREASRVTAAKGQLRLVFVAETDVVVVTERWRDGADARSRSGAPSSTSATLNSKSTRSLEVATAAAVSVASTVQRSAASLAQPPVVSNAQVRFAVLFLCFVLGGWQGLCTQRDCSRRHGACHVFGYSASVVPLRRQSTTLSASATLARRRVTSEAVTVCGQPAATADSRCVVWYGVVWLCACMCVCA